MSICTVACSVMYAKSATSGLYISAYFEATNMAVSLSHLQAGASCETQAEPASADKRIRIKDNQSSDTSTIPTCRKQSKMTTMRYRLSQQLEPRVNLDQPVNQEGPHSFIDLHVIGLHTLFLL